VVLQDIRVQHSHEDPAAMRKQYRAESFTEDLLAADPYTQFARWFTEAADSGLAEPNAMVVSTADADGGPSSRTVLLKGYDTRGFVFYTNYGSRKGRDLGVNPQASLLFPWHSIARQVIVAGGVSLVSREETEAYFHSRPYGSRIGAWASDQSSVVGSREELERRYAEFAARYPEGTEVPVPPYWGGFRVRAARVEFWQGRENRLHDRLLYEAVTGADAGDGASGIWTVRRLAP
jgi:pyridoxamine 5'-phosphate oxidase